VSEGPDLGVDTAAMVEFACELVRVPSVYDPARKLSEEPAAELIGERLRSFGWAPRFDTVAPGRPNVVTVVDGGLPGPTLMFEGHTDVVTEGDPDRWTVDPFGGTISDGRLWGRGSADMKSGVAAMIYATKTLADAGPFPGRIVLAALVDEEGMMAGAKHLVAAGGMEGVDGVICCEPEGGEICHVAKGALRLRVDLHGMMAHGAMPFAGRNPNRAVAAVIDTMARIEGELQSEVGDHEYLGLPWLTPTVLRAGSPQQMNVMPADSAIWFDVRTVPDVDHDALLDRVRAALADATDPLGIGWALEVIDDRPAVQVSPEHSLVRALRDAEVDLTGQLGRLGGVPGATDGTVLTSRTGVPSVVCGPGGKWIAHQADEFVEVADIVHHANLYVTAARKFLAGSAA
jgi:succinyl-diaminopimelate desuccinylase